VKFLLAGGGTGGHVNPLLALAESLRDSGHEAIALGTKEGLESRLVPQRGFELLTVARLPLPRKISLAAFAFPFRLLIATRQVINIIRSREIDAVAGFGGYASAPAYLAAFFARVPLVIHEANARAGFANKLGAKLTKNVAICFPNTDLPHAKLVGMPLRKEFQAGKSINQQQARVELGLDPSLPTLLVTGGSQGARSINQAIEDARADLGAAGIQVLHIVGPVAGLSELSEPGYKRIIYCDAMDAAIAASDFAISRAGASTVSEFTACSLPALYVPYPVGNGEQRFNVEQVISAGGGLLIEDASLTADVIRERLIPLMSHRPTLKEMSLAAGSVAILDATAQLQAMLLNAVNT
jgi:UDP-N-acetylglucosamine--N-acetylmuramyl-(pentapeptide) pyrophosphoryl-undecaprenol N-acetylglucosamine transferase